MTEIQFIASVLSAILSFILTAAMGVVAWYFRKYWLTEIEKNSKHRRRAEGEDPHQDAGKLDRVEQKVTEIEEHQDEEHEDIRESLDYLTEYVRRIASSMNRNEDSPDVRDPRTGRADKSRGGGSDD